MPLHVLIGGLAGSALAPYQWMATLPITTIVVGTALGTFPAAWVMGRIGRKNGLIVGILLGMVSLHVAAVAIQLKAFYLFCGSTLAMGFTIALSQQMRFAAIEYAGKEKAAQAISATMLSGVIAAYIGPEIGSLANNEVAHHIFNVVIGRLAPEWAMQNQLASGEPNYSIAYFALACVYLFAVVLAAILLPRDKLQREDTAQARNTNAHAAKFWLAVVCSVTAFGVMSYVMTATPISMHHNFNFSLDDAKQVIQWHILAMFLPSIVTGAIISRIGNGNSIFLGLAFFILSLAIAMSGHSHSHFALSLIALGVAWNILFTTGTTILGQADASKQQQASHDFFVFSAQAVATLVAGGTLLSFGWQGVLWGSAFALLPCILWVTAGRKVFVRTST